MDRQRIHQCQEIEQGIRGAMEASKAGQRIRNRRHRHFKTPRNLEDGFLGESSG